ncbi:MAG: CBASS oligonucleotide cyclase [Candidatus Heimdallarchaeaceae archaeon]
MGGGGSVFGGGYTPDKYKEIIQKTRMETRDAQFETTVNDMINERLSEYQRDTEKTQERLIEVKEILEEEEIGTIDMRFGGSVMKHTYVDGLSDVDVLVLLNKTELSEASPHEALEYIAERLGEEGGSDIEEIHVGDMAVTIIYTDGQEIQLLPAIKRGEGYKIPQREENRWSNVTRPDNFASKLTEVNQQNNGKVVPIIKIAKSIISQLPEDQQLSGYHVESIAIEVFKSYPESLPKTPKMMLRYFFEHAKDVVRSPIKDKTNQSVHVDDYLGQENSPKRVRVSYALDRIGRRMKNADEIGSVEEWESILGEE